jgi:hypothetical protein
MKIISSLVVLLFSTSLYAGLVIQGVEDPRVAFHAAEKMAQDKHKAAVEACPETPRKDSVCRVTARKIMEEEKAAAKKVYQAALPAWEVVVAKAKKEYEAQEAVCKSLTVQKERKACKQELDKSKRVVDDTKTTKPVKPEKTEKPTK